MTLKGKDNSNWKGGRTITQHGYVLIRVGKDHHLSDVRGYAYEHRIVAEKKIGRRLQAGEIVHHLNENRQDNRPENIGVTGSITEHRYLHRGKESNLRKPGEGNELINCACGCKETFMKFDASNRPRKYVSGHNPQPARAESEILHILEKGAFHRARLAQLCDKPVRSISTTLNRLKNKGLVRIKGRGVWELTQK